MRLVTIWHNTGRRSGCFAVGRCLDAVTPTFDSPTFDSQWRIYYQIQLGCSHRDVQGVPAARQEAETRGRSHHDDAVSPTSCSSGRTTRIKYLARMSEEWRIGARPPGSPSSSPEVQRNAKLWSPTTKMKMRLNRRGSIHFLTVQLFAVILCEESEARPQLIQHCFRQSVDYNLGHNRSFLFISFITAALSSRIHASAALKGGASRFTLCKTHHT